MNIETRLIDPETHQEDAVNALVLMGLTLFRGKRVDDIYLMLFGAPSGRVRGAFNEAGQLQGVGMTMHVGNAAVLMAIAVAPESRRQGVGTDLLAAIETDAATVGAKNMNLTPEDDAARAFFVANHYEINPALNGTPQEGKLLTKPLLPPEQPA
jgi:GNAT superfamily N-acetyltransferase